MIWCWQPYPVQLFYTKYCTLILRCVSLCLLLPRFLAALDNISIYPVNQMLWLPLPARKRQRFCCRQRCSAATPFRTLTSANRSLRLNPRTDRSVTTPQSHSHLWPRSHPAPTLKLHFMIEVDGSYVGMDTVGSLCPPQEALILFSLLLEVLN